MKKSYLSIALLLLFSTLLSACGANQEHPTDLISSNKTSNEVVEEPTPLYESNNILTLKGRGNFEFTLPKEWTFFVDSTVPSALNASAAIINSTDQNTGLIFLVFEPGEDPELGNANLKERAEIFKEIALSVSIENEIEMEKLTLGQLEGYLYGPLKNDIENYPNLDNSDDRIYTWSFIGTVLDQQDIMISIDMRSSQKDPKSIDAILQALKKLQYQLESTSKPLVSNNAPSAFTTEEEVIKIENKGDLKFQVPEGWNFLVTPMASDEAYLVQIDPGNKELNMNLLIKYDGEFKAEDLLEPLTQEALKLALNFSKETEAEVIKWDQGELKGSYYGPLTMKEVSENPYIFGIHSTIDTILISGAMDSQNKESNEVEAALEIMKTIEFRG